MRIWSNDNGDRFPWAVPAIEGGSLEHATNIQVFRNFLPALNELSTPKILTCVEDRNRTRATNWSLFDNSNLSYFVGLDSDETKPTTILSGDRTISTNGNMTPGVWQVASNGPVVWAKGIHGNGCGNIGLADGSVQQDSNGALQKHLQAGQLGTNRFAVP